jgi:hypothetical protein
VAHGPFAAGTQELPANIAKVKVASRDEAIRLATTMAKAIGGDVELEVSKINEPWDIGFGEKPDNAPERYMLIQKANAKTESRDALNLDAVTTEAKESGALSGTIALTPSSKAKRLVWKGGKHTVLDGPFAETKELIGGYAVLEMASEEECVSFCKQYAEILLAHGDSLEIDIRPIA